MDERVIVIEQRLHSGGVAAAIGGITFLFVLVSTIFFETSSSSVPEVAVAIELVVLAALLSVILIFTRVIVRVVQTAEGRALEIVYGPRGVVRQVFEPSEVEGAYARHLSFAEMGGWGYRGSLRLLRQAALVTRRGDALEVELTRRRRFIVTVDDPGDFVAALKATS